MKKLYTLFLFVIIVFKANASHISGGDMSYTWVGPGANTYLVTLNLYRDCLGIEMLASETANATSTCGGSVTVNLTLMNPNYTTDAFGNQQLNGTEISQLCSVDSGSCGGGPYPGMQLYIYQGVVDLSPACNAWTLSWSTCCRNVAANIPTSTSDDIYIQATLNSVTAQQNSSPIFTSQPIPYVCANQPVNYNYGVIEPDGDSLTYQFISASMAGGLPLTYGGGYSGGVPIPGITIDPVTGSINFTPTVVGQFIVVVQVNEYNDAGQLIGTTLRDIQFAVIACSNQQPDINSGFISNLVGTANLLGPNQIELCEGNTFSFTAVYTDPDINDTLSISTNLGTVLTNATYTTSGTNPFTVVYSWTVPPGTAGANTNFVATITDGNCPILGLQTYVYDINVLDRTSTGPDQTICGVQSAQLNASGGNIFTWYDLAGNLIPVGPQFSCNPCDNPLAQPNVTSTYVVQSDLLGTCISSDTVTVNVATNFTFSLSQSSNSACLFQPIQLNCLPNPAGVYSYSWSPASYMSNPNIANPVMNPTASGTYWVYNTVTSAQGCTYQDSLQVTISQSAAPVITAIADTVCIGLPNQLNVEFASTIPTVCATTSTPCTGPILNATIGTGTTSNSATGYPAVFGNFYWGARHQILYTAAELNAMGFIGGKITSIAFNISSLNASVLQYSNFEIRMKCTSATDLTNWESGLSVVYPAQNHTVTLGWNTFQLANIYEWDGVSNLIVETCFNNSSWDDNCSNTFTNTTYNSVLFYRADMSGICYSGTPTSSTERPNIQIGYCGGTANPANYTYAWTPANTLSNPTIINPTTIPPGSPSYQVIVTDIAGGCSDTATVVIQNSVVPPDPTIIIPAQTFYCINDPAIAVATVTPGGVWTGTGINVAGVFNPNIAGVGNHELVYTIYATPTCFISDTVFLDVVSSPNATITTTNNMQICISTAPFSMTSAVAGGDWTGNGVSITGLFDPSLAGPGTHDIIYTLGSGNCIEDDTISITVIDLPNDSLIPAGPFCENDVPYTLQAITPAGVWSGTGITNANAGTFDPAIATPGLHIVTYTFNGVCPFVQTMPVIVKPNPTIPLISNNSPMCERLDLSFITTTIQNASYFWSGPNGYSSNLQNPTIENVTYADSGDYQLYIIVDGCLSPVATTVGAVWPTPPTPVIITNSPLCEGQTLYLETDSFPNASYFWSGPSGFSSNLRKPVIGFPTAVNSGTYEIIKIANGCSSIPTAEEVVINPTPISLFYALPEEVSIMNPVVEFSSQASTGTDIQYLWDFGDSTNATDFSTNHLYGDTGTFTVKYTVANAITGCQSVTEKTVIVTPYFRLFIPSAFSPNGDGLNDIFEVLGTAIQEYDLNIFDRWGGKMFQSTNIYNHWEGTAKGYEAPQGAYVYVIKVKDNKGKEYEYTGTVTLLR
jgi:gliding motility-associated-like protein